MKLQIKVWKSLGTILPALSLYIFIYDNIHQYLKTMRNMSEKLITRFATSDFGQFGWKPY
jgi:hypothetical protein